MHLFPTLYSGTSCWKLELGQGGNNYTMEICKHFKLGFWHFVFPQEPIVTHLSAHWRLVLVLLYRWGKRGSDRLWNLPKSYNFQVTETGFRARSGLDLVLQQTLEVSYTVETIKVSSYLTNTSARRCFVSKNSIGCQHLGSVKSRQAQVFRNICL